MEEEKKEKNNVHTFSEDIARIVENDTGSLVKRIIHEEEEHEKEKKMESPEMKKNQTFLLVSIVFLISSLAILSFFLLKRDVTTVQVEKQFVPIIFNDQYNYQEVSGLKKEDISQMVLNQVNATKVKDGGIEGIYLTENKQIIGLRRFITLIKASFAPGGSTLFVDDNFLMGVEKDELSTVHGARYGFFILLKIRSVSDAFESMRAWEKKMLSDLSGFFGVALSAETNYLFEKGFEDAVVDNKNARILYDKEGRIVIMYVYADENSVVITNSLNAIHEIILRLVSSKERQ